MGLAEKNQVPANCMLLAKKLGGEFGKLSCNYWNFVFVYFPIAQLRLSNWINVGLEMLMLFNFEYE